MNPNFKTPELNVVNGPTPTGKPWFEIKNSSKPEEPACIMIYERIGKD